MAEKKGKILVFSAPSGAGKTTLVKLILKAFPDMVFSISATTRKMRAHEKDGVDYFFLSKEDFEKKISENAFAEYEYFFGNYYGTLKSFINDTVESGKDILLEVDVKGALNLKKHYPEAALIFIMPPSIEELERRLASRSTELPAEREERISRAKMELSHKDEFDYHVVNDVLEDATEKLKNLIVNIINGE